MFTIAVFHVVELWLYWFLLVCVWRREGSSGTLINLSPCDQCCTIVPTLSSDDVRIQKAVYLSKHSLSGDTGSPGTTQKLCTRHSLV